MIPEQLLTNPIFRTQRARLAGVSDFELAKAADTGVLTQLKRGWYTSQPLRWPSDRHRLLVQIALSERSGMVASHHSGAIMAALPVHKPNWDTVHLMRTAEGPTQCRRGLVVHQQLHVAAHLALALVIVQTALHCTVSGLMALDAALGADRVCQAQLQVVGERFRGRPGFSHLAAVLRLADARRESPLESWTALIYDGWGMGLEPQFEVPGTRYRADGRILGTRVLVESDGKGEYDSRDALLKEKKREDELRYAGWEVVRVTHDLLERPSVLLARTQKALLLASGG